MSKNKIPNEIRSKDREEVISKLRSGLKSKHVSYSQIENLIAFQRTKHSACARANVKALKELLPPKEKEDDEDGDEEDEE